MNDVLALREAQCSVAMAGGSEAARCVSNLVLINNSFSSLIPAVYEGRRVINNIERVTSVYLLKTIISGLLALIYIFLPFSYPFMPIHLTLVGALTIGIPTFFLALRPNKNRVRKNFLLRVFLKAVPSAVTVIIMILLIQTISAIFGFPQILTETISTIVYAIVGFYMLYRVSRPLNKWIKIMLILLSLTFICGVVFFADVFEFANLLTWKAAVFIPVLPLPLLTVRRFTLLMRKIILFRKRKRHTIPY